MKFIILTIFCNLLSSGHLQEANNADYNLIHPAGDKSPRSDWPPQTFQTVEGNFNDQAQRNILPTPCSRRSNSESEPVSQQLSPPLASKVEILNDNVAATLKPQALRNEEYDLKTTDNQVLPLTPPLTIDDDNLYKTRDSLSVSNPVIDSFEENHREVIPTINNEIQEDNPKPSGQLRSATPSDSPSLSTGVVISTASRTYQPKPASVRFVPSTEYGDEPKNHYISVPNNAAKASEHHELRPTQINEAPSAKNNYFHEFTGDFHNTQTHTLSPLLVSKLRSKPNEAVSALPNKCSHDKELNLIGHSRRSMSNDNDEDDANNILSNDKEVPQNKNDPYIESHIGNENAMASVLNVEKKALKSNNDQGLRSLDKSNLPTHKSVSRVGRPQFNEARREMIEPTMGAGVVNMGQSSLMLMQTERICYACSTANNPSCWSPDRRTTVKYCRKGNNACLIKTFGKGSTFTLIRDCGKSCDDSDIGGLMPKYKSCSMCHSELCNGAYSINGHSIIFALILIAIVKYLN